MHNQREQDLIDLLEGKSSVLFWWIVESKARILEGKPEYALMSPTSKGIEETVYNSGCRYGDLEASGRGL